MKKKLKFIIIIFLLFPVVMMGQGSGETALNADKTQPEDTNP